MPSPLNPLNPLIMQLVAHARGERPVTAPRAYSGFELRAPTEPEVTRAEVLPGVVIGPPLLGESSLPAPPSRMAAEPELASNVPAAPEPISPARAPIIRVGPPLITSPAPTVQIVEVGEPPHPGRPLGVGETPVRELAMSVSEPLPPSLERPPSDASQPSFNQRERGGQRELGELGNREPRDRRELGDEAPRMSALAPANELEPPHGSRMDERKPKLERESQQREDVAVEPTWIDPPELRDDQRLPPAVPHSRESDERVTPAPVERADRARSGERHADELVDERTKVIAELREAELQRVRVEPLEPQPLQPQPLQPRSPAQTASLAPTTSSEDRHTRRTDELERDAPERDEVERARREIEVRPRDSVARSSDTILPAEREPEPDARTPTSSEREASPAAKPSTPTPPPVVWPAERRGAEATEAEPRRAAPSSAAPRVVQVSIGRVVVRAPAAAPARAGDAAPRATPRMSLDDYLTRRNGGRR